MHPTDSMLDAFLDEALPAEQMAELEKRLRDDAVLRQRVLAVSRRRDAGVHSLAAVWRRYRLSCADRSTLGNYLLGVLDEGEAQYLEFHIREVGCRYCLANLADLQEQQQGQAEAQHRRHRYFQSSADYLSGR